MIFGGIRFERSLIPTLTCPSCSHIQETGRKEWQDMGTSEKRWYLFHISRRCIFYFFTTFGMSGLLYYCCFRAFPHAALLFFISWIILGTLLIGSEIRDVRKHIAMSKDRTRERAA